MQSVIVAVAVVLAIGAVVRAWATGRQLSRLSESYWELRYEAGQLKARVSRLEIASGLRDPEPEASAPQAAPSVTFVPLSTLKK
jgi:hypothetical protein